METQHRFRLGSTSWHLWHDTLLRTTGFPAAGLDRLRSPDCAAAADAFLAGGLDAEQFDARFAEAVTACSAELNEIAGDVLLREAMTWQNPAAVGLLDSMLRSGPPGGRPSKRRYRETQLTRYWQRYCGKTETIGFFGPSTWATIDPGTEECAAIPGPGLLDRREVFLEPWVLEKYGAHLAADPASRAWLPPSVVPHYVLHGHRLDRPNLPPVELSAEQAALIARCDGRRPAAEVVADLVADPALPVTTTGDGFALLTGLVRTRLLKWDANLQIGPRIGAALDARIAAFGDPDIRERAADGLRRLRAGAAEVGRAAGCPDELAAAMGRLDDEFVELTGQQPRRRAGQAYAGRALCYEDTTRDLKVVFGRRFVEDITPALAAVLDVARWVTAEVGRAYEDAFADICRRTPPSSDRLTLADVWPAVFPLFWNDAERPVDVVLAEFARRWALLVGEDETGTSRIQLRSEDILPRVRELFGCARPGWSLGRIHSPDIHLSAPSLDAINAGDYLAVLGELHISFSTLTDNWCNWSRPDPTRNLALAVQDFGQNRIIPVLRPLLARDAGRTVQVEDHPTDRYIGMDKANAYNTDRLTPMGAVRIDTSGDRPVGVLPDSTRYPLLEFFAHYLAGVSVNALRAVSDETHRARITVDRLVLLRETWRLRVDRMEGLADTDRLDERERFLAARRLVAREGLPDRCYVKVATETKPVFVDFTSPLYVTSLAAMLRAARDSGGGDARVTVSEMLPTSDNTWVPDDRGATYFGELRLHLTDDEPAATLV